MEGRTMTYRDAIEIAIEHIGNRVEDMGTRVRAEFQLHGKIETWAALKSAQGGMQECLSFLVKCHAMATGEDDSK